MLAAVLALAACVDDEGDGGQAGADSSHLVPSFPPEGDGDEGAAGAPDAGDDEPGPDDSPPDGPAGGDDGPDDEGQADPGAATDGDGGAPQEDAGSPDADPGEPTDDGSDDPPPADDGPPVTSSVTDPRGDTTSPLLGSAPDEADLVAGSVERAGTGDVTLTLELAAPAEPPDDDTTMNVASFHDLTGDGEIDLELWLNHSEQGWFLSWRDNRAGEAAYGDDTGLAVDVQGPTIELVVPADLLGAVTSWRWSLGLEWGRYESLGTSAAAHDLAPDEGFVSHGR